LGVFTLPESTQLPVELRLEHPEYYISNVELKKNRSTFILVPLSKSEKLKEVVLSTRNRKDSLKKVTTESVLPLDIITSEKLNAYSPKDLITVINETPGVFIHSGAINTNRITIRGVGSRTLYG